MSKENNFLIQINLKNTLKTYKKELTYSFIIGLVMGSIPLIHKSIENFRIQKLIEDEREIQIEKKEKICKEE